MTPSRISAPGSIPNFPFHTMGWKAFQDFCSTILTDICGQKVERYAIVRDLGMDAVIWGRHCQKEGFQGEGTFICQCKHTCNEGTTLTKSIMDNELPKIRELAIKHGALSYIIMTNYSITGENADAIRQALVATGISSVTIWGSDRLASFVIDSPRLRMLVPRVYGLGDLSFILDERQLAQSKALLNVLKDDLSKFVRTSAYLKSGEALSKQGFVLLIGEPGAGKTTIASMLVVHAIDHWKCEPFHLSNADEFFTHWNPDNPKQIIWIDDAFGVTQFESSLTSGWNRAFPKMSAAINKGLKVIFTSRDYIYARAIREIKTGAFPLLSNSQVVIRVEQLSSEEKQEILYNHIRYGDQPKSYKTGIKTYLKYISNVSRLLPETARRLGSSAYTKSLSISETGIRMFVENHEEYLVETIRQMGKEEQATLALVFSAGGQIESPVMFDPERSALIGRMGASQADIISAIDSLIPTFLFRESASSIRYRHPSIRNAIGRIISESPEYLDLYLSGGPLNIVLREVCCEGMIIEGARVVLPLSRYPHMCRKMISAIDIPGYEDQIYRFLSDRADKDFINEIIRQYPHLYERSLRFISYMSTQPKIYFIAHANRLGILPEEIRKSCIQRMISLAIETPDADFMTMPELKSILTDEEMDQAMGRLEQELVPHIDELIDNWIDNADLRDESYYSLLKEALSDIKSEFDNLGPSHNQSVNILVEAVSRVEELDNEHSYSPEPDEDDWRGGSGGTEIQETSRDRFDDVDS